MLSASDIVTGKIVVQLGLAPEDEVRGELLALDAAPGDPRDLVNRLADKGRLDERATDLVRQRAALHRHVRGEASAVRFLEKQGTLERGEVVSVIAELERSAFRKRLGAVLRSRGRLTAEEDEKASRASCASLDREDAKVLERYRKEGFQGVGRPLIPGSRLAPDDFKISTLFRSKETRALVDAARVDFREDDDHVTLADLELAEAQAPAPEPEAAAPHGGPAKAEGMERVKELKRIANYTLVELLGAGGMGAVFLAQEDGRGEYEALKVMLDAAASDEERGRFLREIELTRGLHHRNIITVLDSGTTPDGLTYLVVPALAGKELRAHMKATDGQGLAPALAWRIMEQVLEGMEAVHEAGVVHRDLKPENVFVLAGEAHDVKVMDFGLAKHADEPDDRKAAAHFKGVTKKLSGRILGSPAYIAPESVSGDRVDRRTDIYSLGVMFFEVLTGMKPLEADSPQDYCVQHLVAPPLTLGDARPERKWPRELDALVSRMLGKTREERPASCAAILAELRGGLAQRLIAAVGPLAEQSAKPPDSQKMGVRGLLGRLWGSR